MQHAFGVITILVAAFLTAFVVAPISLQDAGAGSAVATSTGTPLPVGPLPNVNYIAAGTTPSR